MALHSLSCLSATPGARGCQRGDERTKGGPAQGAVPHDEQADNGSLEVAARRRAREL